MKRGTLTLTTDKLQPGDVLTNTVYESLVNEQFHYSPIVVSGADAESTIYYVVNEGLQVSDNWYNVGNKMSEEIYLGLTQNQKAKVTPVSRSSLSDLPTGNNTKSYYFCTSPYEAKTQVKDVTNNNNTIYYVGDEVPRGAIIGPEDNQGYGGLKNEQTGFSIDGIIPTETSTLYVSRETDINDLSRDKIVTVEYWYEYVESDETGNSYETIRERHVVNVHIHFESGVPIIGELLPPRTILPGNVLGLNQPSVTKGAYEILGGGWEIYSSYADAINHKNGTPYATNQTPLYWYQDGDYVAYYAKTYLGKTYSNAVQFSVANYHDMDKVMLANEHHMYVDNPRAKRPPKIYIDNRKCADETKSELDLFNDFFTLSTISTSGDLPEKLAGHALLNERVRNCAKLDFILYSDVSPKAYIPTTDNPTGWTPIGTDSHCFAGWLHGNGYTVSGLNNSLFGKLCGDIYNVGVMGSFTSGGIADSGSGHIENTWVSTTATPTGNPIIGDASDGAYVYNSYYPKEQNWTLVSSGSPAGNLDIIEKPMDDFVNGQVAYLLNSNYLQARYLLFGDKSNASADDNKVERSVFFSYPDGTIEEETVENETKNKEYKLSYTKNTTEWPWHSGNGFVEEYMGTGDYRYSDGIIPKQNDVSYATDGEGNVKFIPVFPDDYIYFGQTLSYDLYNSTERQSHDLHPTGIVKYHTTQSGDNVDNSKHLLLSLDPKTANRVYRAPAYFRNGTFGKSVTFNASAAFAGSYGTYEANGTNKPYKPHEGLTAIDFTGNGDITGYSGVAPGNNGDYEGRSKNYAPLLDYYGLTSIKTDGITRNLLTYAPTADAITGSTEEAEGIAKAQTAATTTLGVLTHYFNDPAYSETNETYRTVDIVTEANLPMGHLVQMSGGHADNRSYTAINDHLLVDKQDFNAPIGYTFDDSHRMWYQRTPDNYVTTTFTGGEKTTLGWEGISLPFSAELVSTQDKGEITHFYQGSTFGHEYWLRQFNGDVKEKDADNGIYSADFNALSTENNSNSKDYTNTFLWDYYYSHSDYKDKNEDLYQNKDNVRNRYYSAEYLQGKYPVHNYPFAKAGTPYLAGFPGNTYFEFDLSGEWKPEHTFEDISSPGKQTITFASATGAEIGVSDTEINNGKVKPLDGTSYTFVPTYLNGTLEAGTNNYVLASNGGSYDKVPAAAAEGADPVDPTPVYAFRPYFTVTGGGGSAKPRQVAERIVFSENDDSAFNFDENDPTEEEVDGTLTIYTKKGIIGVTSSLRSNTEVVIVNTGGLTIGAFTIKPGETIETPVPTTGIYLFRAAGGRYNKKISVK